MGVKDGEGAGAGPVTCSTCRVRLRKLVFAENIHVCLNTLGATGGRPIPNTDSARTPPMSTVPGTFF